MSALDDLPMVSSFLGIDLKTGALMIAAFGVVHPMAYGCTFFLPVSYLLVTIWLLVAVYFATSVVLFFGIIQNDEHMYAIWIWYASGFVMLMLLMMLLLMLVFISKKQKNRIFVVLLGMLWYILTIYFIIVVNSHRKTLKTKHVIKYDIVIPESI